MRFTSAILTAVFLSPHPTSAFPWKLNHLAKDSLDVIGEDITETVTVDRTIYSTGFPTTIVVANTVELPVALITSFSTTQPTTSPSTCEDGPQTITVRSTVSILPILRVPSPWRPAVLRSAAPEPRPTHSVLKSRVAVVSPRDTAAQGFSSTDGLLISPVPDYQLYPGLYPAPAAQAPFKPVEHASSTVVSTSITTSTAVVLAASVSGSILTFISTSVPTPISASIPMSISASPKNSTQSISPVAAMAKPKPSAPAASTSVPFLRGVNLGGWLVLEKWMDYSTFSGDFSSAVDQWTFDSIPGASDALKIHWETYFTEADIQKIASTGINALRIPIGFWAYDNADTPYIQGADVYLEKAIGWARKLEMKVWVDLHGLPGSQNGFDNSGRAGEVDWQNSGNLERSILALKLLAAKYGAQSFADVVVGIELINEPISWGNNEFSVTRSWSKNAYSAVKSVVTNPNLVIVMSDAFQGPLAWVDVANSVNSKGAPKFGIDTHLYQIFVDADNQLTQEQHITKACGWASDLAQSNAITPTYVGEWTAATNICVNVDRSTTPGTSCSTSGCQCQSGDFFKLNNLMIEQMRRYVEAQLEVFESSTSGYFMWAAKGPGGLGFLNGIERGVIPNPVTSRKYPAQCGRKPRRRVKRGLLRRKLVTF